MSAPESAIDQATERQVVEGLLDDRFADVSEQAFGLGGRRLLAVVGLTSTAVVRRVWPLDPSPAEIPILAQRISDQMPADMPVAPAHVEAAFRGALGEAEAIRGLSGDALIPACLLLIKTGVAALDAHARREVSQEILGTLHGRGVQ